MERGAETSGKYWRVAGVGKVQVDDVLLQKRSGERVYRGRGNMMTNATDGGAGGRRRAIIKPIKAS